MSPSTHRTRIKICGLTREADVDAAVAAGADAIGFVLYPKSPRFVAPERAAELPAPMWRALQCNFMVMNQPPTVWLSHVPPAARSCVPRAFPHRPPRCPTW